MKYFPVDRFRISSRAWARRRAKPAWPAVSIVRVGASPLRRLAWMFGLGR